MARRSTRPIPDAIFRGWPMAVLVDGTTTGAAEWLAAAIQDNKDEIGSPTSSTASTPVMRLLRPSSGSKTATGLSTWRLEF